MKQEDFESRFVLVNEVRAMRTTVYGVKTHYTAAGDGDPVVLLHGGGAGGSGLHGWYNTIGPLARRFRVYALDQFGYGLTDKPIIDNSFQALVNHLAGFIDALCLDNVTVIGNSQGAYVGMKYTCDYPERVGRVVTIGSATLATAMGISVETAPPPYEGTRESMRTFMDAIVNDREEVTEELIDARFAIASLPGAQHLKSSIMEYRQIIEADHPQRQVYSVEHRVPALRMPWCVIWGAEDQTAPLEVGRELERRAPNITEFHVVEKAGHQVQNDQPERTNEIIDAFLK